MSLINDALQRAREAQRTVPPPPGPQLKLKPVDAERGSASRFNITLSAWVVVSLLFAFLVLGAVLLLEIRRPVAAESLRQAKPLPLAVASPLAIPAAAPEIVEIPPAPAPPAVVVSAPVPEPAPVQSNTPPVAAQIIQPKPRAPRLQAIFFNPNRPSAIISGTTVFAGDRFGDFRVARIGPDAVMLAGPADTNVLTLQ